MSEPETRVKVRRRSAKPEFRPDIQGLRAVAVLLVVATHAGVSQLSGGFVGVDVFFVISGFLITGLLVKEGKRGQGISLSNFYARRARRILPAATLVLAATVILAVLFLGNVRAGEVGAEAVWAAFFAINWKFSRDGTDYFASNLPPSPLQQYWSLAVEEQFYLVWPLLFSVALIALAARARRHRRHQRRQQGISRRSVQKPTRRRVLTPNRQLFLAGVIALLALASFIYSVAYTASAPNAAYFSALTRIWELAVGALLALLLPQLAKVPVALQAVLSWVGLTGIVATAVLLGDTAAFPGAVALWPVLATALVIAGGIGKPANGAVLLLGRKPMRWVGDRSYSLYLWHWPVLVIGAAYQGRDLTPLESAVLVLVAFLLTMATYTFVEYPIHKGKLKATRQSSLALWPVSVSFVALLGLVAVDAARSVPVFTGPGFEFAAAPAPIETGTAPLPTRGNAPPNREPVDPTQSTENSPPPLPGTIEEAVLQAVSAARERAPVPDPLSPALDQLREDTWERAAPCAAEAQDIVTELCTYGPTDADRRMAIVGDSHAGMWVHTLSEVAERYGWTLYYFVKGGCSSADIVPVGAGRDSRQTGCLEWRDWAVGEIADLAPDVVILANRGDKAMVGPDGAQVPSGGADHARVWEDAVASSVRELSDDVGRVIVFGESPVMDRDPVLCLGSPGADLGDCLTPLADSIRQTNDADERGAVENGGEYVDVNRWLCADGQCPTVINDIVVYTDGQHLTLTFAAALAGTVAAELELT